jgi:outer membrane protein TolC
MQYPFTPYRRRFAFLCFVSALLLCITPVIASSGNETFLSLEAAVELARKANPGLSAKRALANASREVPSQVGALPDPVFMLNAVNLPTDSWSRSQENMTQLQIGFSQNFPFPGKLGLLERSAEHMAVAVQNEQIDYENNLVRQVRVAWWNLLFLDRAIEIVRSNQDLLRQFVRIAEVKYKLGKGLQQDVLLAQLELSKLLDRDIRLVSMREQMEAGLNALLDQPATSSIRLPAAVDEVLSPLPPDEKLSSLALRSHPLLSARAEQTDSARAMLGHAKKGYMPDFGVSALYGQRDDQEETGIPRSDFATLKFSMSIPLYASAKQTRAITQKSEELIAAQQQYEETKNRLLADVVRIGSQYRKAKAEAELFKNGIIPQAEQTVESMRAGYQVNKVDFLNLVQSQITLYNYETDYWKTVALANQALASLKAAVGEENIYE